MGERGDILNGHCDDAMLRVKRRRDTACFGNRNVCTRLRGERHGHGKDLRVEGGSRSASVMAHGPADRQLLQEREDRGEDRPRRQPA